MLMFPVLGVVLGICTFSWADVEWKTFGTMRLGEADVPIRFPADAVVPVNAQGPRFGHGGWTYEINQWGNLGRAYLGRGGWDEFAKEYETAMEHIRTGTPNVWRAKCTVFTTLDLLYEDADGVLHRQWVKMDPEDLDLCRETFARWKTLVEVFSGGNLKVEIDFNIEDQPVRGQYRGNESWSFDPRVAGEVYYRGLINRGDFDCILFFWYPGPSTAFSFGGTAGRTNGATQAYVLLSHGRELGPRIGHTEAMLHEWYHQIEGTYGLWGYGGPEYSWLPHLHSAEQNGYAVDQAGHTGWYSWMRDLFRYSVRPGMWLKMSNRREPDYVAVAKQTYTTDEPVPVSWGDVRDDPWAKLPYLTPDTIAKRLGVSGIEIKHTQTDVCFVPSETGSILSVVRQEPDPENSILDNQLNFLREGMATFRYRAGDQVRQMLFVRWDLIDMVVAALADHPVGTQPPANVLGYLTVDAKMMVVLDTAMDRDTLAETGLLRVGTAGVPVDVQFSGAAAAGQEIAPRIECDVPGLSPWALYEWGTDRPMERTASGFRFTPPANVSAAVYEARAARATGEVVSRPITVHVLDALHVRLLPVGTSRVSGREHRLKLELRSKEAGDARVQWDLPTGWRPIGDTPSIVRLQVNALTTVEYAFDVTGAPEGPTTVRAMVEVGGRVFPAEVALEVFRQPVLQHDDFETDLGGWGTLRHDLAGWTVEAVTDAERGGNVLSITDQGGTHWGRVNAFGKYLPNAQPDPAGPGYDASVYRFVELYLKTTSRESCGLIVTLADQKRYAVMLTGRHREQWGESMELPRARFVADGTWQRVVYDLGGALEKAIGSPGPHIVTDIGFGDPRKFCSNQWFSSDRITYYVDDFRILQQAEVGEEAPLLEAAPSFESADALLRAAACARIKADSSLSDIQTAAKLLSDVNATVRLNAAAVFTRVRHPEVEPALIQEIMDTDARVAEYAARALAFQDTERAKVALREGVAKALSGYTRGVIAELLAEKNDTKALAGIGSLMNSSDIAGRVAACRALGKMGGQGGHVFLLGFLNDPDPNVRAAAARAVSDPSLVGLDVRLADAVQHETSDLVRAEAGAALLLSNKPAMVEVGISLLKHPNPDIRELVVSRVAQIGRKEWAERVRPLAEDANPEVREAARRALRRLQGE